MKAVKKFFIMTFVLATNALAIETDPKLACDTFRQLAAKTLDEATFFYEDGTKVSYYAISGTQDYTNSREDTAERFAPTGKIMVQFLNETLAQKSAFLKECGLDFQNRKFGFVALTSSAFQPIEAALALQSLGWFKVVYPEMSVSPSKNH